MRRVFISIGLILILVSSCQMNTDKKFVKSNYLNEDAVYLQMKKDYTLRSDGSIEIHCLQKMKLLTNYATSRKYGDTHIPYHPGFFKLIINESYTETTDGTQIETPSNAMNEILPDIASGAPEFNSIREMVISHTGLENDVVTVLDYTLISSDEYLPFLSGEEIITTSAKALDYSVSVTIPSNKKLYYALLNDSSAVVMEKNDKLTTYTWNFGKSEPVSEQAFSTNNDRQSPRLIFSTLYDFTDAFTWLTKQNAFICQLTNEVLDLASSQVNANDTKLEIAKKMQQLVADEIRYIPVPLELAGFRIKDPVSTWKDNRGTELEKTILLTALLKSKGIKAETVMARPKGSYAMAPGYLQIFCDFFVKVTIDNAKGSIYYLSAINKNNSLFPDISGKDIILLASKPKPESVDGNLNFVMEGYFRFEKEGNVYGIIHSSYYNSMGTFFPGNKREAVLEIQNGKTKLGYTTGSLDSLHQTWDYSDLYITEKANYFFWKLPYLSNGIGSWPLSMFTCSKSFPVILPYPINETQQYKIDLPDQISLVVPLSSSTRVNKSGKVSISIQYIGGSVTIIRQVVFTSSEITASNFKDFRELVDAWLTSSQNVLVFKRSIVSEDEKI